MDAAGVVDRYFVATLSSRTKPLLLQTNTKRYVLVEK